VFSFADRIDAVAVERSASHAPGDFLLIRSPLSGEPVGKASAVLLREQVQPAAVGPDPEPISAVLEEDPDIVVTQAAGIIRIVQPEPIGPRDRIQARQSEPPVADPQIILLIAPEGFIILDGRDGDFFIVGLNGTRPAGFQVEAKQSRAVGSDPQLLPAAGGQGPDVEPGGSGISFYFPAAV